MNALEFRRAKLAVIAFSIVANQSSTPRHVQRLPYPRHGQVHVLTLVRQHLLDRHASQY